MWAFRHGKVRQMAVGKDYVNLPKGGIKSHDYVNLPKGGIVGGQAAKEAADGYINVVQATAGLQKLGAGAGGGKPGDYVNLNSMAKGGSVGEQVHAMDHWYAGEISREESMQRMMGTDITGAYLVRYSVNKKQYVVAALFMRMIVAARGSTCTAVAVRVCTSTTPSLCMQQ
jgi:hypothetical protein